MPDYSQAKIYKLVNSVNKEIYVGSTCVALHLRMSLHRIEAQRSPNTKLNQKMNELGQDKFRIKLIKDFPCANKQELLSELENIVNELKPQYNTFNSTEAIAKRKVNKVKTNIMNKERKPQVRVNESFRCQCGGKFTDKEKFRHYKTKKHIKFEEQNQSEDDNNNDGHVGVYDSDSDSEESDSEESDNGYPKFADNENQYFHGVYHVE